MAFIISTCLGYAGSNNTLHQNITLVGARWKDYYVRNFNGNNVSYTKSIYSRTRDMAWKRDMAVTL